jgi:hypothetical protein
MGIRDIPAVPLVATIRQEIDAVTAERKTELAKSEARTIEPATERTRRARAIIFIVVNVECFA